MEIHENDWVTLHRAGLIHIGRYTSYKHMQHNQHISNSISPVLYSYLVCLTSTLTTQGYTGTIMFWPVTLTLLGDDLSSMSPRFSYMPWGTNDMGPPLWWPSESLFIPPTRDWTEPGLTGGIISPVNLPLKFLKPHHM